MQKIQTEYLLCLKDFNNSIETQNRIKIAEFVGWRPHPNNGQCTFNDWNSAKIWTFGGSKYGELGPDGKIKRAYISNFYDEDMRELPDYINDLNAIHEAENILNTDQKCEMMKYLLSTPLEYAENMNLIRIDMVYASAKRRAEALLKVIDDL